MPRRGCTRAGWIEKKTFGGLAFLLNGSMSVGVHRGDLIVRIDPGQAESALKQPGARVFDITGRPMKGGLLVSGAALSEKKALATWVERGIAYAGSLAAK